MFCFILLFVTECKYEWCLDDLVFKDAFVLYCIFWNESRWISFEIKWLTMFCFLFFLIFLFVTGCKYEWCLVDLVSRMLCIVLYLKTSQDEYRLKQTKWLTRFFSFFFKSLLFVTVCKYEWCLVDLVSRMVCIVLYLKTSQDEYRLKQMTN